MNRFERSLFSMPGDGAVKRHFSAAEADKALVLVRPIVSDIVKEYQALVDFQEILDAATKDGKEDRKEEARLASIKSVERIHRYVEELELVGVELRDWTLGIVEFPSIADGREIRLCWQSGETKVCHWHELDQDYGLRQPLDSLPVIMPKSQKIMGNN